MRHHGDVDKYWMVEADLDNVVEIEQASYHAPWSRSEFAAKIKDIDNYTCVTLYPKSRGPLQGYCVYRLEVEKYFIENITIRESSRHRGYGRFLLDRLQDRLSGPGRRSIEVVVSEEMVSAQLFYAACGFRWSETVDCHYPDGQDGYRLVYWVGGPRTKPVITQELTAAFSPARNRLEGLL